MNTCENNDPDFNDVNSEDPLAERDKNDKPWETLNLFQGRRVVEYSVMVDYFSKVLSMSLLTTMIPTGKTT